MGQMGNGQQKSKNAGAERQERCYAVHYRSLVGDLTIAGDGTSITGLWLDGQKYFAASVRGQMEEIRDMERFPAFAAARDWLDRYFAGGRPDAGELPLKPSGSEFRQQVWKLLREIPYGGVVTYKELAEIMAEKMGRTTMSAQAVGQAVSHNPISIIIPCHRVIGKSGSLTGYAGGIDRKVWLLKHEGVDLSAMTLPGKTKQSVI